jgi:formylmethanofuran dehydrogenase subunit B
MSSINTQALQALLGMLSGDKKFLLKIINFCLQLELKGKHRNLAGVLELVSQLNNEYEQVEIALKKITQVL